MPTTVIVFAREPIPGKTKTRLAPRIGATIAVVLADAFLRDTLAKVTALGIRLVIAADTPKRVKKSRYFRSLAKTYGATLIDQAGGNLGARMARALSLYVKNDGVILIGSDAPSLPVNYLKRALALLTQFDVVLGPALDGGYYLIGARGSVPKIFRGVPWGERDVLQRTIGRLQADGTGYTLAPPWYDVDSGADLATLTAHLFRRGKFGALLNICLPLGRTCPCPATARVLGRLGI